MGPNRGKWGETGANRAKKKSNGVKQGQTWATQAKLCQTGPYGVTIIGMVGEQPWVCW